jgi:DNA-binding response OmpR family regulator
VEPTVVVVEDDARIVSFMRKGLRANGYLVEWIATGTEAIERCQAGGVDIMLLDLGLPDIDGLEVLRRLRASGSTLPVIVITARTDPRDRASAMSLGVTTYLTKPYAWADLLTAVNASASVTNVSEPSLANPAPTSRDRTGS